MGRSICKSLHKYLQLRSSAERVEGVVRNIEEFHECRKDAENGHEEDAENANDSSSDEVSCAYQDAHTRVRCDIPALEMCV